MTQSIEETETIGILLSDVTRLFWRRLEGAMRADGCDLTAGEARVLVTVARAGGLRQSALAERLFIEPMTLVGFLDRLERHGHVERLVDATDRRAKLVRATELGDTLAGKVKALATAVRAEVTADLDASEIAALRQSLFKIRMTLSGSPEPRSLP
jgi:MarR family transcriptional regulator for hemolysin